MQSVIPVWLNKLATLHSNAMDFSGLVLLSYCGTQIEGCIKFRNLVRKLFANFYIVLIFTLLLTLSYVQQVATSTANCCHFVAKVGEGLTKVANKMCGGMCVPFVVGKGVGGASVCIWCEVHKLKRKVMPIGHKLMQLAKTISSPGFCVISHWLTS